MQLQKILNSMSKEHIGVGVRIRPLAPQQQYIQKQCITVDNNHILVTNNHKVKSFQYHKMFDKYSEQQQIFEYFGLPLLQDMLKGYNSCLVVYGQNKSGKTYTICGKQSQQSKGIIPRIVDHINCKLYAEINDYNKLLYIFRVSYIDIYEQQIIDLLTIRKGIQVKIINNEGQIQLKNLQIKSINKIEDIQSFFLIGNRKRQYAFTKLYRYAEKTTSIFTIYYQSLNIKNGQKILIGRFDIVDYHASHIVKPFDVQIEIKNNKQKNHLYDLSISSFKNVIQTLAYGNQDSNVPYNDSKVTKLLRQSIGGNCKTKILFHITPTLKCYGPIIDTLRLATSCNLIENIPSQNINDQHSIIKQYLNLKIQQQKIQEQLIVSQKHYKTWMDKLKQQQNEFITQVYLHEKYQQQYGDILSQKNNLKENIKNKINSLFNLFIKLDNINKHQVAFFKDNYQNVINKLYLIQKDKVGGGGGGYNSFYGSGGSDNLFGQSSKKYSQRQRKYKQQINDLRLEYQQQKDILLNTLRQVEMKYKFYQKIAKNVLKKEEIDIIKMNSKYDSTKRSFQLPLFAIRDKKIAHSSNYYSPNQRNLINSRSNSERRFLMSKLSNSKIQKIDRLYSPHQSNRQNSQKNSQKPREQQHDDYFQSHKNQKKALKISKKQQPFKMGNDEYQMIRSSYMQNKLKLKQSKKSDRGQNTSLNSSKGIKIIKPLYTRFKFK